MNDIATNTAAIALRDDLLRDMMRFGETGYPEEVVGFLFGIAQQNEIILHHLLKVENHLEADVRSHRYLISPTDWLRSEMEATRLKLDVVGVFHTHPDHPSKPSFVDLEFALPNLVYVIAAIHQRKVVSMQAWKLRDDRVQFDECLIHTV